MSPGLGRIVISRVEHRHFALNLDKLLQQGAAKHLEHAFPLDRHGLQVEHLRAGAAQNKAPLRVCQGILRYEVHDMPKLGAIRTKELLAGGNIEEEISHCERGS